LAWYGAHGVLLLLLLLLLLLHLPAAACLVRS
jgi:hypothetical protein